MNPREACGERGSFLIFSKDIARVAGGLEEGIFFQYVIFRLENRDAAVCLSAKEVEEETLLTWARQARAREVLCARGLLLERKQGLPARIFFRVDFDKYRELATQNSAQTAYRPALGFPETYDLEKSNPTIKDSLKLDSENVETYDREKSDSLIKESRIHSSSQELVRTNTENNLCEALSEEKKQKPKTKPQDQPTLSLPAVAPTKIDPIALLRGDHDSRRDRAVIEATVALWASVWSRNPSLAAVTKDRERIWRDAVKTYPPSAFAKAVIGMWWDPSPADRAKFHEFTHVSRALETWVALYDEHGDPRDRAGFRPGCPPKAQPAHGGGRGGDRAHGGSQEVLSGQAALDKVAAETRARRERDRKQAEESSTPEAIEARRLAFEAMDKITAKKGGGRR